MDTRIKSSFLLLVLFCFGDIGTAIGEQETEYAPIVKIDSGEVRGVVSSLLDGSRTYLYQGIRYGRAKRFQLPRFVEPWSGVYDAVRPRDPCPQLKNDTPTGNEDCLYLNVWRPERTPRMLLPVMVWIHGGTFISGTIFTGAHDGRYMSQMGKVIIVSINYRLGPFGFLYGAQNDAPGNQGLHDQILGLKWVQKNIQHFGGDPNRVTLFGESAGSMAVGALVLSPLTDGLFHRAIMQSGAPNSYIGSNHKNQALNKTISFSKRIGCMDKNSTTANMTEILDCLRTTSMGKILETAKNAIAEKELMIPIYGDSVMPHPPVEALRRHEFSKSIDLLFGVNRNEGTGFLADFLKMVHLKPPTNRKATKEIIYLMMLMVGSNKTDARQVADFYVDQFNGTDLRMPVADAFGDYQLVCPSMLYGEYFARAGNGSGRQYYAYRLMLPLTPGTPFSCVTWEGVCHGEDVAYLFIVPGHPANHTEAEIQLSKDMIHAWTKFAYGGIPGALNGHPWDPALDQTSENSTVSIMELNPKTYGMINGYFRKICDQFWKPRIFPEAW